LKTVQHRVREKTFLQNIGVACTPFRAVSSESDLQDAISALGCPAVLKTAAEGYDGKGQARIDKAEDAASCWKSIGSTEAILEGFVDFSHELSILAARGTDGSIATYGPISNQHEHHILDVSVVPLQALSEVGTEAIEIARTIVTQLDVTGIICVEFFLTEAGQLLVNEIAPRPHNSGHLTIDGFVTSQFEQQVRTVCGMPLGSAVQAGPAAMANLLGDLWRDGEPDWQRVLEIPEVKLHLYGKESARPGRKMGHLTALADTAEEAERMVRQARELLTSG
jgi:5-(carboxyamino)imidazole ribonucleotide synthase